MAWRVARSLDVLLTQFNNACPGRNTTSDGAIGNAEHVAEGWTASDHNPWWPLPSGGVVTARDFTHDPAHGLDIGRVTDQLAASRDPRIKYIIANNMILDSRAGNSPWQWVPYHGVSPHREHLHLSVMDNPSCDDLSPWLLPMFGKNPSPVPHPAPSAIPDLNYGQSGPAVASLQRFLNFFGWRPPLPLLVVDGQYGNMTVAVVRSAQAQMGIAGADGRNVGPQTRAGLWARGWRG